MSCTLWLVSEGSSVCGGSKRVALQGENLADTTSVGWSGSRSPGGSYVIVGSPDLLWWEHFDLCNLLPQNPSPWGRHRTNPVELCSQNTYQYFQKLSREHQKYGKSWEIVTISESLGRHEGIKCMCAPLLLALHGSLGLILSISFPHLRIAICSK